MPSPVTPALISALYTSWSAIFSSVMEGTAPWYGQIAMTVPSSSKSNTYGFMDRLPALRQWIGPRHVHTLSSYAYEIENQKYELSWSVPIDDLSDDAVGVYSSHIQEFGRQAAKWPDDLVLAALEGGTAATSFDGVNFFATTHPLDPAGNQSNNYTGTALTYTNYCTVRAAMSQYTGYDGRPLGIMPNLLIVPPALERVAKEIAMADVILDPTGTAGVQNVMRGQVSVLVIPELSSATTWFMADMSRAIKPLIFQQRMSPEFVQKTAATDSEVYFDDELHFGCKARGAAGYGFWPLIARCIA